MEGAPTPLEAEVTAVAILRAPGLRRLAALFALFKTSEMGAWLAVTAFAHQAGGVREASAVLVAQLLPAAAFAPFVGSLTGRFGARTVQVAGLALQSAALFGIAALVRAGGPDLVVYGVAIIGTMAVVTTRPTIAASLPAVTDDPRQITAAHAIMGWLDGVATLVGPALTAICTSVADLYVAFALFGILTGVAAVLGAAGRSAAVTNPDVAGGTDRPDAIVRVRDGVRAVVGTHGVRPVLVVLASYSFAVGAVDLLFVVVGVDVIGGTTATAGWLSTAFGAGTLVGGAVGLALIRPRLLWPWALGAGLLMAAALASLGVADGSVAVPALALAGSASVVLLVAGRALLQRLADLDVVCHAFALAESSDMTMLLVGTAAVPLFVSWLSPAQAGLGVAAVVAAALLLGTGRLARAEASVPPPTRVIEQLRTSPILGLLPPTDLETLARCAVPVRVGAGDVVIREGDPGDRYYVVTDGRLRVSIGGDFVRTLSTGDGFGELALLHTTRRTATVTAVEPAELLAVDRTPFLVTVTGHPPAMAGARDLREQLRLPDGD